MLSKAKLKTAIKKQDIQIVKEIIPSAKQFKIMARDKAFHRLIVPAMQLLFNDKEYYKRLFAHNVMTTMFYFMHKEMKDFSYLKESEYEAVHELLIKPLLEDQQLFFDSINNFYELKYFELIFANHKKELANMVIASPELFWRVISSFSNLQEFCADHPDYARDAILFVLCNPAKMKSLLVTALYEAIFAGYCLIYGLIDSAIASQTVPQLLANAKEFAVEHLSLTNRFTFFYGGTELKKNTPSVILSSPYSQ